MNVDLIPSIREFCSHWKTAPTLQQTFEELERSFAEDNDACLCSCRAIVECACQILVSELDDPASPVKPKVSAPTFGEWVSAGVKVLGLGDDPENTALQKLVSLHHKLTTALGALRNSHGTACHGRDGFADRLSIYHRRSAVLAADALIGFLHQAYLDREVDPLNSSEPHSFFDASNVLIDAESSFVDLAYEDGYLSLRLLMPGDTEVPISVTVSEFLYGLDREAYRLAQSVCTGSTIEVDEDITA